MFKKFVMLILGTVLLFNLAGCGNDEQSEVQPDVHTLAKKLRGEITFEDSVDMVSGDVAVKYYGLGSSEVMDCDVYMSTGATSEEIAVFEAFSENGAIEIYKVMSDRRDKQVKDYFDRDEDEVARLDAAVIYRSGRFVVYVVCDDSDRAEDIIKGYLD